MSGSMRWKAFWAGVSKTCAVALGIFTLYTASQGILEAWKHRLIHVTFMLLVLYAKELSKDSSLLKKVLTFSCFVLSIVILAYSLLNYQGIIIRGATPPISDQLIAGALVFLALYAGVLSLGLGISAIATCFLLYFFVGPYLPGLLHTRGISIGRAAGYLYNTTYGILGSPIGMVSTYIVMFVIFGAVLSESGGGQLFIDLSLALTRKVVGGPAMAAVIASGFFGSISGSAVANVVATGAFTIPLMKKAGYKPEFAAGVEAAASTGGMFLPPIMASVAFLIAEFTRTPYVEIMKRALIPALLYFFSVGLAIYLRAKRRGIGVVASEDSCQSKSVAQLLKEGWYYLLVLALFVYMLMRGQSPMKTGFYASLLLIALSYTRKETRMGPKKIVAALESGIKDTMSVSIACAVAGIIIASINATGLGLRVSSMILGVAGNSLPVVLLLTALVAIILGMGINAASVYIIVVSLLVPALVQMGVLEIGAHFFAFYFGIASCITPPVALAAYAAAGLANSNQSRTGWIACRLACVAFIIPFVFVYDPAILCIGTPVQILTSAIKVALALSLTNFGLEGYLFGNMSPVERGAVLVGAGFMLAPIPWSVLVGSLVGFGGALFHAARMRRTPAGVQLDARV